MGVLVSRDANHTPDPRESNQEQEDARLAKVWADEKAKVEATNDDMAELADRQNLLRALIGQEPRWASNREAGVLVDEVDTLIGLRQDIDTVLDAGPDGDKESGLVQNVAIFETNLTSASVWAESYDEEIDYYNCATVDEHRAKIAEAEFAITAAKAVQSKAAADLAHVSNELRFLEAEVKAIEGQLSDLTTKRYARGALSALALGLGIAAMVPGPWSIALGVASIGCGLAAAYVNGDFGGTDAVGAGAGVVGTGSKTTATAVAKVLPKVAAGAGGTVKAVEKWGPKISKGAGVVGALITAVSEISAQLDDSKTATGIRGRLDSVRKRALAVQPKYDATVAAAAAAAAKVDETQAQLATVIQEREMIARPTR